jgi:hypothetical protein
MPASSVIREYGAPLGALALVLTATISAGVLWERVKDQRELATGGVVALAVVILEWRFRRHERWERQNITLMSATYQASIDRALVVADGIASSADKLSNSFRENTNALRDLIDKHGSVQEKLADHEGRLKLIEDRWMRPALVPGAASSPGPGAGEGTPK